MTQWYYERNSEFLDSPINKRFEEILWMTQEEFRTWVIDMRNTVVRLWDEKGQPPRVGFTTDEMIQQFSEIEPFLSNSMLKRDDKTGKKDVVHCTMKLGNAVNQFFPTMMKTRINYSKDVDAGKSIYDYFTREDLLESFINYATRNFKRDSFYSYSMPVKSMNIEQHGDIPVTATGTEWIREFETTYRKRKVYDYFLCPSDGKAYTGYKDEIRSTVDLTLTRQEIESLGELIPEKCKTNVNFEKNNLFTIRVFKFAQKIFPIGFKAFRVTFCQYAVNFPPLVAKFIYERYTAEWKDEPTIFVWDPSAGWGGRLIGALGVEDSRHITYLANDPNEDHLTTMGRTKYHEVYDFYTKNVKKGGMFEIPHNEFKFWHKGSEDMQFDPRFQKYRGKLSLVFTSPPYFSKEAYSEGLKQSYRRFSQYDLWKDGFLRETLKTAVFWLRPGGYLVWNVADVVFSGETLPLEQDSVDILKELGMEYIETIKMTLAQAPGGNRIDEETGTPRFKNSCMVDGSWKKFEPLLVFRKPK